MGVLQLRVQFFSAHHVEVHHVADVQVKDPVLCVFDTECVPHVELEPLVLHEVE